MVTHTRLQGLEATSYGVSDGAWCSGPSGGSMSRIRIREPLLARTSPSGPSEAADLLRVVLQFPLVALEAHPPRADPPVDLV